MGIVCSGDRVLGRWLNFSGRAARAEFAGVWLVYCLLLAAAGRWGGSGPFVAVLLLGAVPLCCVSARRLHDTNRSAAWLLLHLLPLGSLFVLWWASERGDAGANRFGAPAHAERVVASGLQA